tara:strand:+ start:342 stop:719 length:378 start_codon:yes stop_codon:yes gene_type:complete
MADAVLPEPILTPTVTVIGADHNGARCELVNQWSQLGIHPCETSKLSFSTFLRITLITAKGTTWARTLGPRSSFMPVGDMSFTNIEEHKTRVIVFKFLQLLINPRELLTKTPRVAGKIKMFEGLT